MDEGSGGKSHAVGNEVLSPSHAGGGRVAVRRLASVLVGRLGQKQAVLFRDAGEGHALKGNGQKKIAAGVKSTAAMSANYLGR